MQYQLPEFMVVCSSGILSARQHDNPDEVQVPRRTH